MCSVFVAPLHNLKSNMDRFIDLQQQDQEANLKHLKSNMDRFIAVLHMI